MGFFLQAQTPTRTKKDRGNCYGYMWREGYFNGQVLLWAEPSPFFSSKNTMVPMGTFCFVTLFWYRTAACDRRTDRQKHTCPQHISRSHSVAR